MSNSTLETQVKKQSILLSKEVNKLIETSSALVGKYVAYFNGDTTTADTHAECFEQAVKKFGNNGFALAEVSPQKAVLSALVKF